MEIQPKAGRPSLLKTTIVLAVLGAALAMTVGSSSAQGAGEPPVNVTLPVVSPESPIVGQPLSATTGTWKNEPTKFEYWWYRCQTKGGCEVIPGGRESTYVPTEADYTRTLRVEVVAENGGGRTAVFSNSTKAVGRLPQHWYICTFVKGGGSYADSKCSSKQEKGPYVWKQVTQPKSIKLTSEKPLVIEWGFLNVPTTITCNQTAGGVVTEGPLELTSFGLNSCTVTSPASYVGKCEVKFSGPPVGVSREYGEQDVVPMGFYGSPLFSLQFSSVQGQTCKFAGYFGGLYEFEISTGFGANVPKLNPSVTYLSANDRLIAGGYPATVAGKSQIEGANGEALKIDTAP